MVASRRMRPAQRGPHTRSMSKARRISAAHLQNLVHQMRGPLGHPPPLAGQELVILARDALRQAGAHARSRCRAQGLRVELANTAGRWTTSGASSSRIGARWKGVHPRGDKTGPEKGPSGEAGHD